MLIVDLLSLSINDLHFLVLRISVPVEMRSSTLGHNVGAGIGVTGGIGPFYFM